jgi:histidine triad (HIT) family protein
MLYDSTNIFAKIIRNEIPCYKVYEDEQTLAFMDVMPQSNGHVLVVPKNPSRNLLDADSATLVYTMIVVQKIAHAALQAFAADGVIVAQYNESSAGQSVFHLHFHVIPRYEGTGLNPHSGVMEESEILSTNAIKLRNALVL